MRAGAAVSVFTHRRPADTGAAIATLREIAGPAGITLRFDAEETGKHGLAAAAGVETDAAPAPDAALCVCLGGDGTILHGLRAFAGTGVPVFGVNYGEVGFLAAIDPDELRGGLERALRGDFETLDLPAIRLDNGGAGWLGFNDVSVHRRPGLRVADLAYAIGDDEVGRVRCDGLVVATPAGSTGYNLANGGPVMAWGVEGFAVSFIAPHSLTARALVVAPRDVLRVANRSRDEPVEVSVDGRPVAALEPGEAVEARFLDAQGRLAQIPGATFYHRVRERFGRLAS